MSDGITDAHRFGMMKDPAEHARKTIAKWPKWKQQINCSPIARKGESMNALIKQLQTNENPHRIFADMTPDEQACLKKVGRDNCQYLSQSMGWESAEGDYPLCLNSVYRIKPDYQPQYVDLEICNVKDMLGILEKGCFRPLYVLPSLPGFRGFWSGGNVRFDIDRVAELMKDHKMYARIER